MASRLLLITPEFYGIEMQIKNAAQNMGYDVEWFENKTPAFDYHGTNSKLKILRRIYFFIFAPDVRYIRKQLGKIGNQKFDIFLSINCHAICLYLIKRLKKRNPYLNSILYLWDSLSMYSWEKESRMFDKVYTFDKHDSIKYDFIYRPNFFINENVEIDKVNEHDLFFVGKFTLDRLKILDSVINQCIGNDITTFFKVLPVYKNSIHSGWLYLILKKIRIKTVWNNDYLLNYEITEGITKRDYLISRKIEFEDVQKELFVSNVVLDIPFSGQSGYSHRVIEALAKGKKVLTTNDYLKKESFYNPNQIRIIDRSNPAIDHQWVKEKNNFPINSYFSSLELSNWLESIIID